MTTTDFVNLDPAKTIAVLPLGAIEQHGPHLPLCTDTLVAESLASLLVQRINSTDAANIDMASIIVLPTVSIGLSLEHSSFNGTLTMPYNILVEHVLAIGKQVINVGIRKLIMLNAHGGNPPILEISALELRQRYGMLVVKTTVLQYPLPEATGEETRLASARDSHFGIHGGTLETSMVMHLRPDLVRLDQLIDYPSTEEKLFVEFSYLGAECRQLARYAWMSEDLNVTGVCGESHKASAEKGKQAIEHFLDILMCIINEVAAFSPPFLFK
jgi:creatinine amidohydrolase